MLRNQRREPTNVTSRMSLTLGKLDQFVCFRRIQAEPHTQEVLEVLSLGFGNPSIGVAGLEQKATSRQS